MKQNLGRMDSNEVVVMATTTLAEALRALCPWFSPVGEASTVRVSGQ